MRHQQLDRPEESSSADVTLVMRGITVTACVETSTEGLVVVRPAISDMTFRDDVHAGDPVELYWIGGTEERTLPGKVVEVGAGREPRWRIAVKGRAEVSQRRKAVRARMQVPIELPWAGAHLQGTTIDVSEAGMRALVDGWGVPMDPGTLSQVTLLLDDAPVLLHGEIVWTVERGAQWLLAIKFRDVPERTADLLRKRVFQVLRDERAADAAV